MKKHLPIRLLSMLLVLAMCVGLVVPSFAAGSSQTASLEFEKLDDPVSEKLLESALDKESVDGSRDTQYAEGEIVRVSIVLEDASTVEKFGSTDLSSAAVAYRDSLKGKQNSMVQKIDAALKDSIDVVWNLTFAGNIISANVRYEQIEEIAKVQGVKKVFIENRYEPMVVDKNETNDPNMATSSAQIGSSTAWAAGYTGAGSKIAVIDTGIDYEQQSFSAAGYEYSIAHIAGLKGMSVDEYKKEAGILTKADLTADVLSQLNAASGKISADKAYVSAKIPFAYNYIDKNYTIDHVHDTQGEHGSHVEGIAAANAYIQQADGTFASALDTVKVQGVAPDAQLVVMKVFGSGGGAYDSDYMVAIEDAVMLGCDSVNLSLGSGSPGFSRVNDDYAEIMASLANCGTVVSMSAGNSGYWAENAQLGYLYADDVSMQMDGSPGSFTNSLAVASVDNDGFTGSYFTVGDMNVFWNETDYSNAKLETLAGTHDYVILPAGVAGNAEDYEGIDVTGKVVFVQRGGISFYVKGENAVNAGAIATVVYNNAAGVINMDLSDYTKTAPCVSITMADGLAIWDASTKAEDESYATGSMTINKGISSVIYGSDHYTMSSFSSWGVPGSLELKPEITAPGGSIYSVNGAHNGDGAHTSHTAYETMSGTSMASPQVAGMAAVMGQYIRENKLDEKTGLDARALTNSLLMSTATPLKGYDDNAGEYIYSVMNQGAGLANVGNAVSAASYILMKDNLSGTAADGKVKAEFGDDPERTGEYTFEFSINNLSGTVQEYTFSADVFTQDIFQSAYNAAGDSAVFMDTLTAPLAADVTYDVDGKTFVPTVGYECDVNKDEKTDAADAQAILDYTTGANDGSTYDLTVADINKDGKVNSYDAYLFLSQMKTDAVQVPVGTPVNVKVTIKLTAETKAYLDQYYTNGAYVEGYVYVGTNNTDDGAMLPVHSIPMLGFYGNWSDASMLDTATLVEQLYGDTRPTYLGLSSYTNYNTIKYPGEKNETIYTVNPYVIEDEIPYDRAAINSGSTLAKYAMSVIRNAAAAVYFVKDETTNEILYMGGVTNQFFGAYYYTNGASWKQTQASLTANQKIASLGLKEGDKITAGVALIPEYYEDGAALDKSAIEKLITSDKLGDGAYFANTYTVDNTAPELLDVEKDMMTGALTVVAKDNQYIAFMGLFNASGKKILTIDGTQMAAVPSQDQAGEKCGLVFPLTDAAGEYVTVTVADYAGNEVSYKIKYGGTPENFTGRMFGFTSGTKRGNGPRWVEIDPTTLTKTEGMTDYADASMEVYAAEYAGKYVFFATADGFYAAPQDELDNAQKVAPFPATFDANEMVADMAMNPKDQTMYVLTNRISNVTSGTIDSNNTGNKLYTMDLVSGELTKVADITVNHTSSTAKCRTLRTLAIDANGKFYGVNAASGSNVYLYQYTLDEIADGALTLDGAKIGKSGMYVTSYASMAYDQTKGTLYLAGAYGVKSSGDVDNELWVINPETPEATQLVSGSGANQFYDHLVGLYVVPANTVTLPTTAQATKVELREHALTLLKGSAYQLSASVIPWLASDKTVTWTSSNTDVVSVDQNGEIKTLAVGEADITVASKANPALTDVCHVTVEALPEIKASALIYGDDSKAYWSEFSTDNTAAWTKVAEGSSYVAGTLHEGELLVHNGSGNTMFGVDPDTFEVTSYGTIASSWQWSDAAASPAVEEGLFGRMVGICMNGTYLEMLNPVEGTLSYWDLSTKGFADDPLAVIAFIGSGTYDYNYLWYSYPDCPANFYYAMTESGELYKFNMFTYDGGESYSMVMEDLGNTGLELTNVSAVTGGQYASMIYDQATGYLLVSSYQDGETAKLYAIDPAELIPAEIGSFGEKVWPVVSLYQYNRATDLTLKVNPTDVTIYVGESKEISTKVILGSTNELTWSSANPDVATVENGVITGAGEGNTTVTVTTVDTNAAGKHVSKDINVNVKGYVNVDATVNAQVTNENGTAWSQIDLGTKAITAKSGYTATKFYGAGYSAGALWGTDIYDAAGHIYKVNATTFEESQGSECSTSYAIRDVAENPAVSFTLTEENGTVHSATTFGDPIYISNSDGLYELADYVEGSLSGWRANPNYADLVAIAYIGDITVDVVNNMLGDNPITECDSGTTCHVYYVLNADGDLYQYITVPVWDTTAAAGEEVSATLVRGRLGNIGMTFEDTMNVSMDYISLADSNGLLIADATDASIYYANLTQQDAETRAIPTGKVCKLNGVTGISGLYSAAPTASGDSIPADLLKMMGIETKAPVNVAKVQAPAKGEEDGYALETGALISMRSDSMTALDVSEMSSKARLESAGEAVNASTGSLNALKVKQTERPQSIKPSTGDAANHVLTVTISDDVAVTNGKYVVEYDPAKVTLTSKTSSQAYKSFNVDETNGKITFAFAAEEAVAANTTLATLTFSYGDYVNTEITVKALERNEVSPVEGDEKVIKIEDEVEHKYGEPVWSWTGVESATATFTCEHDATHTQVVNATITSEVTKPATCTEDGVRTYTATVTFEGKTYTDTKTDVIKATGHKWGEPTWSWTNVDSATASFTCENDASHKETVKATITVEDTKKATCTEDGVRTYTATVTLDGKVYTDTKTRTLPATGHNFRKNAQTGKYVCENCGKVLGESENTKPTTPTTPTKPGKDDTKFPFTDVSKNDRYYDAVDYLYNNGIMNGTTDTLFSPNAELTRAMVVTILYRAQGKPAVSTSGSFKDVAAGR
ncbi:MAG: S8 family serine peptidase, partial [Oscillospiraceae bacterium]|nr:S8 family serine peptidase [Oscillospiraceae bacterium]